MVIGWLEGGVANFISGGGPIGGRGGELRGSRVWKKCMLMMA